MKELTQKHIELIKECLQATVDSPLFRDDYSKDPYWEYPSLFGYTHKQLKEIIIEVPKSSLCDPDLICSLFSNLLGYPHGHIDDEVWNSYISIGYEELSRTANEIKKVTETAI